MAKEKVLSINKSILGGIIVGKSSLNVDETILKAAKEAAKEAIFEFDKSQKDKRFHNT